MNPILIRLAVIAGLVLAGFGMGWAVNGWRLGAAVERLEGQRAALEVRLDATGKAAAACSASVEQSARTARAAIQQGRQMLEEARRLHAGGLAASARVESLLAKPTPAGAGCDDAWATIEKGVVP